MPWICELALLIHQVPKRLVLTWIRTTFGSKLTGNSYVWQSFWLRDIWKSNLGWYQLTTPTPTLSPILSLTFLATTGSSQNHTWFNGGIGHKCSSINHSNNSCWTILECGTVYWLHQMGLTETLVNKTLLWLYWIEICESTVIWCCLIWYKVILMWKSVNDTLLWNTWKECNTYLLYECDLFIQENAIITVGILAQVMLFIAIHVTHCLKHCVTCQNLTLTELLETKAFEQFFQAVLFIMPYKVHFVLLDVTC